MKRFTFLALCLGLAACQTDDPQTDSGLSNYDPNLVEIQRTSCEAEGGQFQGGEESGRYICYQTTKDANTSCSQASDCEAGCLARSRTCAPIKPMFGCHEFIGSSGLIEEVCLN